MSEKQQNDHIIQRGDFQVQDAESIGSSTKSTIPDRRCILDGNIQIVNQFNTTVEVLCICYTETHEFLVAGCVDGTIRFYKLSTHENTMNLRDAEILQNPASVTAVGHRPVHKSYPIANTILATYANGCVKCWHYPTSQCLFTIREGRQTLGLAYHPRLPKFVTVGDDSNVVLYDEETKAQERVFRGSGKPEIMDGHKSRIFSACFNPKSAHELISGGWDDTVQFWDTRQSHALRHFYGVHMCGDGIDISKNGREILTCSWQRKDPLQLWDYGTGKLIVALEPDSYSSLLYCGKYVSNLFLACGGSNVDVLRIVDLRSHSTMASIKNLPGGVYSLQVGPMHMKLAKKLKSSASPVLPQIAFCAGKTLFEINAQPG